MCSCIGIYLITKSKHTTHLDSKTICHCPVCVELAHKRYNWPTRSLIHQYWNSTHLGMLLSLFTRSPRLKLTVYMMVRIHMKIIAQCTVYAPILPKSKKHEIQLWISARHCICFCTSPEIKARNTSYFWNYRCFFGMRFTRSPRRYPQITYFLWVQHGLVYALLIPESATATYRLTLNFNVYIVSVVVNTPSQHVKL